MKLKHTLLTALTTVALVGGLSTAAEAGTPTPIPYEWGGGSVSVDLPDFTFPAASGCTAQIGSLLVTGDDRQYLDYDIYINATDPNGTSRATFSGTRVYAGATNLNYQICAGVWQPGTYTVGGNVTFNDFDTSATYTAYVSDTFTISPYVAPPAPAPAPVVYVPPAPTPKVSQKCKTAKAQLKTAKKKNRPYKVIKAAQKKVKRAC